MPFSRLHLIRRINMNTLIAGKLRPITKSQVGPHLTTTLHRSRWSRSPPPHLFQRFRGSLKEPSMDQTPNSSSQLQTSIFPTLNNRMDKQYYQELSHKFSTPSHNLKVMLSQANPLPLTSFQVSRLVTLYNSTKARKQGVSRLQSTFNQRWRLQRHNMRRAFRTLMANRVSTRRVKLSITSSSPE